MGEPTFGISLEPTWDQRYCVRLAKLAEGLGFTNAWVPDGGPQPPFSDAIVTLAAIASRTERIRFGSAILNFYTRNPAQIASSFLALSNLGGYRSRDQRAILGLGLGSSYNVAKFGIFGRKGVVGELREAVESIRGLFRGEEVSVRTDHFKIERVRVAGGRGKKIPIYVGSASPKGLRLSGEVADGVILTERIASEVPRALRPIELGLGYAGRRRGGFEVVNSVVVSVSGDREKARNAARATCAYLAAWLDDGAAERHGLDQRRRREIASRIASGDEAGAAKLVDAAMLDLLTVSGTAEECVEKCREHVGNGVDQIAFCEPFGPGDEKEAALRLIAKRVIPKL